MSTRQKFKPKFHADMVLAQMIHQREELLDEIARLRAALESIAVNPHLSSGSLAEVARQALATPESPDPAP